MVNTADIIICGAGSAGVAAAYYLARVKSIKDVLIVDKHPPLSQTSAKSGENYRNWWPNRTMVNLMNHSIDLMESLANDSNNVFHMQRRGYVYATSQSEAELADYLVSYEGLEVGKWRYQRGPGESNYQPLLGGGYQSEPIGVDFLFDPLLINKHFPYISNDIRSLIHIRRAGAVSSQQLGMYLLQESQKLGVRLLDGEVVAVNQDGRGIKSVDIEADDGIKTIDTRIFINAAGPQAPVISSMLNIKLPVYSILQQKIAFQDNLGVIPRDASFTIFMDEQQLDWSEEETQLLLSDPEDQWLLERFPGGLHIKPEGGLDSTWIKIGWAFNKTPEEPQWEPKGTLTFTDIVIRGATRLVPELSHYVGRLPKSIMHYAGYYTRTKENLPLIGPLGVDGAFVLGALSGFGTMASCAAGELLADWIAGDTLPDYAADLSLARYDDPIFINSLADGQRDGEL